MSVTVAESPCSFLVLSGAKRIVYIELLTLIIYKEIKKVDDACQNNAVNDKNNNVSTCLCD